MIKITVEHGDDAKKEILKKAVGKAKDGKGQAAGPLESLGGVGNVVRGVGNVVRGEAKNMVNAAGMAGRAIGRVVGTPATAARAGALAGSGIRSMGRAANAATRPARPMNDPRGVSAGQRLANLTDKSMFNYPGSGSGTINEVNPIRQTPQTRTARMAPGATPPLRVGPLRPGGSNFNPQK